MHEIELACARTIAVVMVQKIRSAPAGAVGNLEAYVPDKTLLILIILVIVLIIGHDFDHFLRGDYRWDIVSEAVPIIVVTVLKYAILGGGFFLYLKGLVGPRFWAILAGIGVVLAWLAHFSPFTDQPPQWIYNAYATPIGGTLAVAWLTALMLTLISTTLYAQVLWARAFCLQVESPEGQQNAPESKA
jgi:hypothetical protein